MAKTSKKRPPARPQHAAAELAQPAAVTARDVWMQVWGVLAVAAVVRAIHFVSMRNSVFFDVLVCDGRQYDVWARRVAAGNWIGDEIFYQTPLYPYFLAVIYAIAGHHVWLVRIAQAVFGSLACVFVARAGSHFFSHRVGWIAGLMLAVYPPAIFFDGIIQKAALDLFFMSGILWAAGAAQHGGRLPAFALAGLSLGAMTLNRENAVILIPILLAWAVWLSWSEARAVLVKRCAVLLAGVAVVLLPVGLRNYYVGGQFLLTTSQMGPNFYIGNHAGASGTYEPLRPGRGDPLFESQDARLLAEQDLQRELTPGEVSSYWMERSLQDIKADPAGWLRLLVRKWVLTWNTLELVDAESIRVHQSESPLLGLLGWFWHFGTLCPLAAAGIWLSRGRWRDLWLLYAMLAAFALAVTMFFVFARYRYPLVPVAMLFAAAAVTSGWSLWRQPARRGWELGVAAAIFALVAVFCNLPQTELYNDDVAYITAGTGLIDEMRPAEAIPVFEAALRINPRSPHAYNNLGVAASKLNRYDDALKYFEQAIAADPKLPPPYQGLGETYFRLGQRDEAIRHWQLALALDPNFAQAYRSLGNLELASGNLAAAVEYLERSLRIEPDSVAAHVDLALARLGQGKIDDARNELRIAIERIPPIREANNLAWILATAPDASIRELGDAVYYAELAGRATDYGMPDILDTLAAAHANAGNYEQAVHWIDRAIEVAKKENQAALLESLRERRQLYAAGQPFRDPHLAAGASAQ